MSVWILAPKGSVLTTFTEGVEYILGINPNIDIYDKKDIKKLGVFPNDKVQINKDSYYRLNNEKASIYIGVSAYDTIGYSLTSGGSGDTINPLDKNIDGVNTYKSINMLDGVDPQDYSTIKQVTDGFDALSDPISDVSFLSKHTNISSFVSTGDVSLTPFLIPAGDILDIRDNPIFPTIDDSLGFATDGNNWLDNSGASFISFYGTDKIQFPDLENTTQAGVIDSNLVKKYSLFSVNLRLTGFFANNIADAIFKVKFYSLNNDGTLNDNFMTMDFVKEFLTDFDVQSLTLDSRLSKDHSTLIQNGLTMVFDNESGEAGLVTLTKVDILFMYQV